MQFRVDADRLQIDSRVLHRGDNIKEFLVLLNLRKDRAKTLTKRIHVMFCALAAARVRRGDGWVSVDEIGQLEGWSSDGSVAKLLANELEFGAGAHGIVEQKGRGSEAQLRLKMSRDLIELGDLPDTVRRLFGQERQPPRSEYLRPQPIAELALALAVADAFRTTRFGDLSLLMRPLYQGGHSSLVFGGLAIRTPGGTAAGPVVTSVLLKLPLGLSAGNALTVHQDALDTESELLSRLAGWPGIPARIERLTFGLGAFRDALSRYRIEYRQDMPEIRALMIPLGVPRTVEAEPRLLSSVIDETAAPIRRLTRRDIHNALLLAERLATLTRLLHRRRRAHRHLSVDAIVIRHELGILDHVLAADLAGSVEISHGSDELLYRDLFDLGRVLVHVITGRRPSGDRQNWQPPDFPGRALIKGAVVGEGETVARLLFAVGRYLLEASPWKGPDGQHEASTVRLLDHFLEEIEHIHMLHWSRARGVPERRVSLGSASGLTVQSHVLSREVWSHSAADPVATRLVTVSHLVNVPTLRQWCERYITSHAWHISGASSSEASDIAIALPSADRCIAILQKGFGRSAAQEMWRYLREAGPDEPVESLVRILRNYATHWFRERRFDVGHDISEPGDPPGAGTESRGLRDELDVLRRRIGEGGARQLLIDWIDELKRRVRHEDATAHRALEIDDDRSGPRPIPERTVDEQLRSWMYAGALRRLLRADANPPTERDIYDVERALHGRSSPETVFWHILLARAWVSSAAQGDHGVTGDGESGWDKAMRALLVAAGVATARKLPFETAATLSASAYLTRLALSTSELRAEFTAQGVDEESVRVQGAECALMAADAYLWLDNQWRHCRSLLEAAALLVGSAFPERLIQGLQLIALARNNRLLDWQPPQIPERELDDSAAAARFERYPPEVTSADTGRFTALEDKLFVEAHQAWIKARGRVQTSDDPGMVVAHGYSSRHASGGSDVARRDCMHIDIEDRRVFDVVLDHYKGGPVERILDFGCGAGRETDHLAKIYGKSQVWAVDSPVWFAARADASTPGDPGSRVTFIKLDPVDYARRVCRGNPPEDSPLAVDVVLFRGSLSRVSQRTELLEAAFKLLRPRGLVVGTDWVQSRTTDRITFSRLLSTGRFVDLETRRGYEELCKGARFAEFRSWGWDDVAPPEQRPMQRLFQRRLDEMRRTISEERSEDQRSPYERALLLRARRDLEVLAAVSAPRGPLGWVFWAARKTEPHGSAA